jgi:hypothetical protein
MLTCLFDPLTFAEKGTRVLNKEGHKVRCRKTSVVKSTAVQTAKIARLPLQHSQIQQSLAVGLFDLRRLI